MMKLILFSILFLGFSFSTQAINKKDINDVNRALQKIKNTPSGMNLLEIFDACNVTVDYKASYFDSINTDASSGDIKKGDKILDILFSLKAPQGDSDQAEDYEDLTARWVFRDNEIIPESGWATNFQDNEKPISWQDCP